MSNSKQTGVRRLTLWEEAEIMNASRLEVISKAPFDPADIHDQKLAAFLGTITKRVLSRVSRSNGSQDPCTALSKHLELTAQAVKDHEEDFLAGRVFGFGFVDIDAVSIVTVHTLKPDNDIVDFKTALKCVQKLWCDCALTGRFELEANPVIGNNQVLVRMYQDDALRLVSYLNRNPEYGLVQTIAFKDNPETGMPIDTFAEFRDVVTVPNKAEGFTTLWSSCSV